MLTVIVVTLTASERNLTLEMESEDKQDFEDAKAICRICLTQIATFKDIRYEKIEDVNVLDMFNAITDFKVTEDDTLTKKVCEICLKRVEDAYRLRKQIEDSYDVLQKSVPAKVEVGDNYVFEIIEANSEDEWPAQKKPRRLVEFSYNEVVKAIKECKNNFFENTECIYCGFSASNSRALAAHMAHLHKDAKGKWCSRCNAEVEDLETHTITHDQQDKKCRFCSKTFQARGHLVEHLRSHTKIRPFKCNQCDKCFISSRHLKVHANTHMSKRPYKCRICSRTFVQAISFKNHLKSHEDGQQSTSGDGFACGDCDEVFDDKNALIIHECAERSYENPLPQNFCSRCKRKVRSLSEHTKRVHANKRLVPDEMKLCTICGKQFKTASKLNIHMRIHTGDTPYKCSFCDKRLSTRNNLIVHERTHTGEKPHICNICGKGFAQSSVLKTHMRLHTGRPEVCNICNKRFCRPAELRLHMRRHTGEKPYLCVECGQGFIQRSHLTEHVKIHTGERPYKCTHCNKAFKQSSSLKSHVFLHLGYKPYKCNQCPFACRQPYSLTNHMAQRHSTEDKPRSDKPHVCLLCHKGFSTMAMLISHNSNSHNTNMLKD